MQADRAARSLAQPVPDRFGFFRDGRHKNLWRHFGPASIERRQQLRNHLCRSLDDRNAAIPSAHPVAVAVLKQGEVAAFVDA